MAMKYCKILGMVKVNYDVEIRLENNLYATVKRNEKKDRRDVLGHMLEQCSPIC
jgi:hypothetical protein